MVLKVTRAAFRRFSSFFLLSADWETSVNSGLLRALEKWKHEFKLIRANKLGGNPRKYANHCFGYDGAIYHGPDLSIAKSLRSRNIQFAYLDDIAQRRIKVLL